ncbi:MAG: aminotransferase class III-fold pyridoxal phosphate-dependent enzyme, partial [Spirochaetales bacterium]|nr:aminotransferase class III-fold pyridoxal phosphate-dependent enzyme [Spirochaetales bacterium]
DPGIVLTTGGAEAVEVALKSAFIETQKPGVVTISQAYHGQSIGVLNVNDHKNFTAPFSKLYRNIGHVLPYLTVPFLPENNSRHKPQSFRSIQIYSFDDEFLED